MSRARFRVLWAALLLAGLTAGPALYAQTDTATEEAAPTDAAPAKDGAAEASDEAAETPAASGPAAVLQGLDKITARISTFDAPLNQSVRFGSLEIVPRTCHKTPPEEPPERAAFLEITDVRPDSDPVPLFTGWMFASSPALSALEHPVYDVWVIDCKKSSTPESEVNEGN